MARNNDNGLYLPLRIDLNEWEKQLTQADADLQKTMKEMKGAVSDLKLRYDIEITNAKNAGNDLKVIELEATKLNHVYEVQKETVEALTRAYNKLKKEKGENAEETVKLGQQLINETKAMEQAKMQLDSIGMNFGKRLSDGLAEASPEFARIRTLVSGLTKDITKLGARWATVGKAFGAVGLVAGLGVAGVKGAEALVNGYKDVAISAAQANEEVYQLREELNDSYENAELLAGAARIDGTNLQELGSALNKLHRQLQKTGEGTNYAQKWLERYNVSLLNGDGTRKNTIEQMKELQRAFLEAERAGEGRDFLANTLGNSSDKFMHFVRGFDDYAERAKNYQAELEKDYDTAHKLLDLEKERAEAQRQLDSAKGNARLSNTQDIMETEIAALQEQYKWYEKNAKIVDEYGKNMVVLSQNIAGMNNAWEAVKTEGANSAMQTFNAILNDLIKLRQIQKEYSNKLPDFMGGGIAKQGTNKIADMLGLDILKDISFNPFDAILTTLGKAGKGIDSVQERIDAIKEIQELRENKKADDAIAKMLADREAKKKKQQDDAVKKEKEANDRRLKGQEAYYKALRDLNANEYEKEMNRIYDKKEAYLKAGMDEVQALELINVEKDKVNQKWAEKEKAETEKKAKENEKIYRDMYNKQIEEAKRFSEEQKRARESAIAGAESTLSSNLKLLRYIKKEQEKGTYTEAGAKEYANKLYMKQHGFRQSDIDFYRGFGQEKLADIANARDRIFGSFAPPVTNTNNNNITVNFDNTIVEDMSAMEKIANKVAEVILPVIKQAVGGTEHGY